MLRAQVFALEELLHERDKSIMEYEAALSQNKAQLEEARVLWAQLLKNPNMTVHAQLENSVGLGTPAVWALFKASVSDPPPLPSLDPGWLEDVEFPVEYCLAEAWALGLTVFASRQHDREHRPRHVAAAGQQPRVPPRRRHPAARQHATGPAEPSKRNRDCCGVAAHADNQAVVARATDAQP